MYLNSVSYNLDVAKVFGVCSSVFLSCLNYEYSYQLRHKQLNSNNTMSMSRAEIYERTGLDDEKQIDVEVALSACGVLQVKPLQNVPNKNYYIINIEQLNKILASDNPEDVISSEKAKQFIQGKRVEPTSKRQTHISQLKKYIKVEDPVIADYLVQWIDAVYSNPKGFLSTSGVTFAQQELLEYAKDDQDKQIKILKEAIKGGYRDMTWAIQKYEDIYKVESRNFAKYSDIKATPSSNSGEVF